MVETWGTGVKDYTQTTSRISVPTFKKGEANFFFKYNRDVNGVSGGYYSIFVWAFDTQYFLVNKQEKLLDTDEIIIKKIYVSCDASVPVNVHIITFRGGYGSAYTDEIIEYNDIGTVVIEIPKGWKFSSNDFMELYINNPDDVTSPYYHNYTVTMFGTSRLNMEKLKSVLEGMGLSMDNA